MGETRLPAVAVNSVLTSISGFSNSVSRLRISVSIKGSTEEKLKSLFCSQIELKVIPSQLQIPWSPKDKSACDQSGHSEISCIIVTHFKELSSSYFLASRSLEEKCKGLRETCCHIIRGVPYLITYLLTPWSRVHLEKLTGSAASQEIPRIFGTRRFITVLTSARHLSLS